MTIVVSLNLRSLSRPASAFSMRIRPSDLNGIVTTPIVRAPSSFATRATYFAAPVDRIRSAAAAADDLDRDVDRFDDLLDLFIVAGFLVDGLGLRGFALFLCLGFLVSGQSLVQKRFHCAIPSRRRLTAGRIHLALFKSSHTYVRQTPG